MSDPARRRISFDHLPAAARYGLALVILAVVVAAALALRGGRTDAAAGWYLVLVRVGAVFLLAYLAFRLVRRGWKPRRPGGRRSRLR